MKRLIKDVKVTNPQDKEVKVDIEVWGRANSEEETWLFRYKGRLITPYERRIRGWKLSLNALFILTYGDKMQDLIQSYNPFMSMIPKFDDSPFRNMTPVILGLEHGVTFGKT